MFHFYFKFTNKVTAIHYVSLQQGILIYWNLDGSNHRIVITLHIWQGQHSLFSSWEIVLTKWISP